MLSALRVKVKWISAQHIIRTNLKQQIDKVKHEHKYRELIQNVVLKTTINDVSDKFLLKENDRYFYGKEIKILPTIET